MTSDENPFHEVPSESDVPIEPPIPASPPPQRRPRVWTVFLVFVAALVINLIVSIVLIIAIGLARDPGAFGSPDRLSDALMAVVESPSVLLLSGVCTMALFSAAAIMAAFLSPVGFMDRLRLRPSRISPFSALIAVLGVVSIGLGFAALGGLGLLPESPFMETYARCIGEMSGLMLVGAVLVIGFAPGIAEELLFRGYVQTRLSQRWGPGWAIFCTSLLFGMAHMELVQGTFAVGMGIYLGFLTERTGSIRPAMLCHAANNTVSVLATAHGVNISGQLANTILLAATIGIICLSAFYLRVVLKPSERQATDFPADSQGNNP